MNDERPGFGWYVYGIAEADAPAARLAGVETLAPDEPARLIRGGDLAAIASRVPLSEFGAGELPGRLGDTAWIVDKLAAHEAVLEHVLEESAVIPFRFGTIYDDEDAVRDCLAEGAGRFASLLARLDGLVEVGVKATVDRDRVAATLAAADDDAMHLQDQAASTGAGTAYLLRRRDEQRVASLVTSFAEQCAEASHAALAAVAREARVNPPQTDEMILNGAYLVTAIGDLDDALDGLRERFGPHGIVYVVTGPWPPYNFVDEGEQ